MLEQRRTRGAERGLTLTLPMRARAHKPSPLHHFTRPHHNTHTPDPILSLCPPCTMLHHHHAGSCRLGCRRSSVGAARFRRSTPALHRAPRAGRMLQQQRVAYQSPQASSTSQAQQQQQQQAEPQQRQAEPQAGAEHHIDQEAWDLSYWHYQPWWLQPPTIIATGIAFVLASIVLDNEELSKTAMMAAGPVLLYWCIFLFVLPRRFKSFAVDYIETHPETEAAALEHQQQQIAELIVDKERLVHEAQEQQEQQQ